MKNLFVGFLRFYISCIDIQDVQLYLLLLPGKKDKQTSITNPFPNCRISMHLAGKQEHSVDLIHHKYYSYTVTSYYVM